MREAYFEETSKVLDEKKAIDVTAIKTEEVTIVSDYFVIASGTSNTHVKSLADDVEYEIEMKNGNTEYDFEIDARTGAITKFEKDVDDDQDD